MSVATCNPIFAIADGLVNDRVSDFTPIENLLKALDNEPVEISELGQMICPAVAQTCCSDDRFSYLERRFEMDRMKLNRRAENLSQTFEAVATAFEQLPGLLRKLVDCAGDNLPAEYKTLVQEMIAVLEKHREAISSDLRSLPTKFQSCGTVGLEYLAGANCAACDAEYEKFYDQSSSTLITLKPSVCDDIQTGCSPLFYGLDDMYQNMISMASDLTRIGNPSAPTIQPPSFCTDGACDAELCKYLPKPLYFSFTEDIDLLAKGEDLSELPNVSGSSSCEDIANAFANVGSSRRSAAEMGDLHNILAAKITKLSEKIVEAHSIDRRMASEPVYADTGVDVVANGRSSSLDTTAALPAGNTGNVIVTSGLVSMVALTLSYLF